jgi:hypothetical protein
MSTATVLEALQRNFGGLPSSDFCQVVKAFLEHLRRACGPHRFPEPRSEDFRPTLEVLAASLSETGHSYIEQHATLSDKSARPKLVIDYTGVIIVPAATAIYAARQSSQLPSSFCQLSRMRQTHPSTPGLRIS